MAGIATKETLEKIWNTEFDEVFLHHLKQVLTEYDKGHEISFNRLGSNPAALRGFERGSRIHVAASFIAQRGGSTSSKTPFSSESTSYQSLIQEQLIESWARHEGCWVECTDKYLKNKYGEEIGSGSESHVYLSLDRTKVIKEWKTFKYESIQLALDRITIHNTIFPETSMEVLGFGRTSYGNFVILVSQAFIQFDENIISDEEVINFMKEIGFDEIAGLGNDIREDIHSEFANADFYVADLHKENIGRYTDSGGKKYYFVIDCAAYFNTPGLQLGGTYDLGLPDAWAYKSEEEWQYAFTISDNPLDYQ